IGAVTDDDYAGVLRISHANSAAVMNRHPRGAARGVEKGIEQRPVRDGVGAVAHRFGLAIRARDGAGVEVIAPDDDRRLQLTLAHHLVEGEAEAMAIAEPDPADARRQALELNAFASHAKPLMQSVIVRQHLTHLRV